MNPKIKLQKGFIQIPLLIVIIVSVVLVSGATTGIVLHKQGKLTPLITSVSQIFKGTKDIEEVSQQEQELEQARLGTEKKRQEIEKANTEAERLRAEQEEAQRIAELEQRIKELETKQQESSPKTIYDDFLQEKEKDSEIITADDLDTILRYVGSISCGNKYKHVNGSASIWVVNWNWGKNIALTNAHIFPSSSPFWCIVGFDWLGNYKLNTDQIPSMSLNNFVDFAFLEIKSITSGAESTSVPIASLSSDLESVPHCPKEMSLGSPVAVIGYPVSAMSQDTLPGGPERDRNIGVSNKAVTNGIISSHDGSPRWNGYPDSNYFVSAKIDSGNSGGLAVSKHNGELCILGIPTWVQEGHFENMGIVQSIHNIWNPK